MLPLDDGQFAKPKATEPATDEVAGRWEIRPTVWWPMALQALPTWLNPWIMLWRYWRGWSELLAPSQLQQLLEYLRRGCGTYLYATDQPIPTNYQLLPGT